jgi:hypothetical protein
MLSFFSPDFENVPDILLCSFIVRIFVPVKRC